MQISQIGIITHPEVKNNIVQKLVKKLSKNNIRLFFDPIAAKKIKKKGLM